MLEHLRPPPQIHKDNLKTNANISFSPVSVCTVGYPSYCGVLIPGLGSHGHTVTAPTYLLRSQEIGKEAGPSVEFPSLSSNPSFGFAKHAKTRSPLIDVFLSFMRPL